MTAVLTGIDVLIREGFRPLSGKRIGLLTNASATDRNLTSSYRLLWAAPQVQLVALFAPEHGFAAAAAEAIQIGHSEDVATGLPVYSLYGDTLHPTPAMLSNIDLLVCDLQDAGARFYTYVWTLSYLLEAAAAHQIPVMILDRPNPLPFIGCDGPLLDPAFATFVGRYPIPLQHDMTIGELGLLFNAHWITNPADLQVVQCEGWQRGQSWAQTGLPWVPPSPNMPQPITALHYPGACLVEGTTLSEGRGTTLPFQITGAPFIDAERLAHALKGLSLDGVRFRPLTFTPLASKWAGESCSGIQAHIIDLKLWRPIVAWLTVINTIRQQYPDQFAWNIRHFDRLCGSDHVRLALEAGSSVPDVAAEWNDALAKFDELRQPHLLYRP